MAWRGIHISQPAKLKLDQKQLAITQGGDELFFAIEDLAWVIFDTPQITLTCAVLSALCANGVIVLVPDEKHLPNGLLLPFHQHYTQSSIAHLQVAVSSPLKKRLWQKIIKAKIRNQAHSLQLFGAAQYTTLNAMAERVNSGDPENIEAQAARLYWTNLFDNFVRKDDNDPRNCLLNYGYAIVRAAIARACTAHGLLPTFGVHHCSQANAFNLADDLIEPLRPLVDFLVCDRLKTKANGESVSIAGITVEDRRYMANILNHEVMIDSNSFPLLGAIETIVMSLVRAMQSKDPQQLLVPSFWERK